MTFFSKLTVWYESLCSKTSGVFAPERASESIDQSDPHNLPAAMTSPYSIVIWMLIIAAVFITAIVTPAGWDVGVYHKAVDSVRSGHDPYLDAIATQKLFYSQNPRPAGDPPFDYVYSPITLPLLHLAGAIPIWLTAILYWLVYFAGILIEIWIGMLFLENSEWRYFIYLAPITIYFPGLLANGTVLGGNVAYILYPLILTAALHGWRRGNWRWLYLATLLATCFKAPFLSMAVIPPLSARRQWVHASLTAAVGLILFIVPFFIWPDLFQHYLQAVQSELNYNHDFGCSPSGLLSGALNGRGISYITASSIFYLTYAIPLFFLLVYLSLQFQRGAFSLKQWAPVLLVGVTLLNPRIIEYDIAPVTLFLALITWRFFNRLTTRLWSVLNISVIFIVANVIAAQSWAVWKLTECPLLVLIFLAGSWTLLKQKNDKEALFI
jgi:hypothetical protein